MKKTFLAITMATAIAMACFINPVKSDACFFGDTKCQKASIDYTAIASSKDFSSSNNSLGDFAEAWASGASTAKTQADASGKTFGYASGNAWATNNSYAWTQVYDYGKTSYSYGEAYNIGSGWANSSAQGDSGIIVTYYGGKDGGPGYYKKVHGATAGTVKYFKNGHPQPQDKNEWVFIGRYIGYSFCGPQISISTVTIEGTAGQVNVAFEEGDDFGQFAFAGNTSKADFSLTRKDTNIGFDYAYSNAGFYGYYYYDWYWYGYGPHAYTYGGSNVSIDDLGNERSASASTWNYAYTSLGYDYYYYNGYNTGNIINYTSNVSGEGIAQTLSAKDNTVAYGTSKFSYNGSNYGSGSAYVNTSITNYGTSSTAYVSGSASSYVSGGSVAD
jgi:hypothetical protein